MQSLRIALMTHGTRGDVQPLVVVARELERRGHRPVLAVPVGSAGLVRAAGLEVVELPVDWREYLGAPDAGRGWVTSADSEEFLAGLRSVMAAHVGEIARTLYAMSQGADLIVSGSLTEDMATVIAEARGIPLALLQLFPVRPNDVAPNPFVTSKASSVPGANRATHAAYERAAWQGRQEGVNRLREAFGLAPTQLSTQRRAQLLGALEIQGYSQELLPGTGWLPQQRPFAGWLEPQGQDRRDIAEHGLDPDLASWLDAGDTPAYFGFGSTPIADPAAMVTMIEKATGELGLRAVITSGWAGLPAHAVTDPARIHVVDSADLTALLPRCRFAVHHGGSGTTGAAARAGLPALVASGMLDQPMWGELVLRRGAGIHLPLHHLTTDNLRSAMQRLLDPAMVTTARELGRAVRAEGNAAATAADLLTAFAQQHTGTPALRVQAGGARRPRPATTPRRCGQGDAA